MQTAQAMADTPVFDAALVEQFKPTIDYLIKDKVFGFNSSDVCYEREDVYQECLIVLNNAIKIFDPSKGMKFKTFAIMHLKSRLGNFRNKVTRKNDFGTVSFSDINSGWGITGREEGNKDHTTNTSISPQFSSAVSELEQGIDSLNELIDAKRVLEKLSGQRKILFEEFYIMGNTIKEICENHPDMKYHQVRRHMKYLEQIYSTLVKGDTPCLQ